MALLLPILATTALAWPAPGPHMSGAAALACPIWPPERATWLTPDDPNDRRRASFFHVDQNTYGLGKHPSALPALDNKSGGQVEASLTRAGYGVVQHLSFAIPPTRATDCELVLDLPDGPEWDAIELEGAPDLVLDVYQTIGPSASYAAMTEHRVLRGQMTLRPGRQVLAVQPYQDSLAFLFEFARPGRVRAGFQQTVRGAARDDDSDDVKGMHLRCGCARQQELKKK